MKKHYVIILSNTDLNRGDQALIWESISVSYKKIFRKRDYE